MKLYIDGDALPNLLKPIILKRINKLNLQTVVISNKKINIGRSLSIDYIVVSKGIDEADKHIIDMVESNDLVVTADIPLANSVVSKGAYAIDHRGELYTLDNIKQYLAIRNLMEEIRNSGEITKGPAPFNAKDVHKFANNFNNFLAKSIKNQGKLI